MNLLSLINKSTFFLITPLLSVACLHADNPELTARGEARYREAPQHHQQDAYHPEYHEDLNRGDTNHVENQAEFDRGLRTGAYEGAAVGGALNNNPAYQEAPQYQTPVPVEIVPNTPY